MNATLEYELSRGDLEAFFAHHAGHAPYLVTRNRRMRWIWAGVFGLLALVEAFRSPARGVAFLVPAVIFLIFYDRFNRWWYIRHNRRLNAGADGPRLGATKLKLADGKLFVEAPESSSTLELSAIRRIDESASHYFFYLGPVTAIIVPRVGSEVDAFVQAVRHAQVTADAKR